MLPIYRELLNMWSNLGFSLPLQEGKFWLHNNFVQGFLKNGQLIKLYKLKVFDDLHIEITSYKKANKNKICFSDFETWQDTINRNKARLETLEMESLKLIKQIYDKHDDYNKYVLVSTGKDSMVVMDLVQKVQSDVKIVFNNTSLDCSDTYKMVNSHKEWIVTNPDEGFYQWIKRTNFIPTRFGRACCGIFKEGNMINSFNHIQKAIYFMGIRNDESNTRKDREDIGKNPKWTNRDWFLVLPIRKWSELDIWLYTIKNELEINDKYKKGYHRCGCAIACPYATKYTWYLDEYWFPEMRRRWLNILDCDFETNIRSCQLNCTKQEYHYCWNGGLYRPEPTNEVINEFMSYKGFTNRDLALQYFNKKCECCEENVRQNDVLAMNLKFFGRNSTKILCKKCLMKELNINSEEYDNYIEEFKSQGCQLF